MSKFILFLKADGTKEILANVPTLEEMQTMVGGYIERVRILDRVVNGLFIYTSMFVNDEGLLKGLPRNEQATQHYQRNARKQFPNSEHPFAKMEEEFKRQFADQNVKIINPLAEVVPGYDEDPWIAGNAILFLGYTCEEVDRAMDTEPRIVASVGNA
jgi:Domain of unknown function (DUF3846)